MFRKFLRATIRPLAVRYRRFMQAELVHEIVAQRTQEAGTYSRSLSSALLTIALHQDEADKSKAAHSDSA